MSKKTRIIILSVLAVLIVVVLSVSITTAFMKPIDQGGNITEVSLSSCAKIKLEGTTSIKLTNSYPMSRNKGLQTTPYTFTVTSYCDTYVGFNLYLATLNTNTLSASNIHYIITEKGSKETLVEGTLTSSLDDASNFTDAEKTELNAGLSGTYGNIFKLYNNKVPYKGSATYDLYLFVDENATEYQNTTFAAGVAVKSYEREKDPTLADYVKSLYTGTQGDNNIYYHDSSLTNGAGDSSYRYSGANPNNYVCFGSNESTCPTDNLYRIIGVFGNQVKLIKYDYGTTDELGTDGDYSKTYKEWGMDSTYKGTYGDGERIGVYYWNNTTQTNTWSESLLNKTNLNTNFINNIGEEWANKIATTTWKVGGNIYQKIINTTMPIVFSNEITSPSQNATYNAKIGLMYVSDYGFAASPDSWKNTMSSYTSVPLDNWMYMGFNEWTITRNDSYSTSSYRVNSDGYVDENYVSSGETIFYYVTNEYAVRPSFYLESFVTYDSGSGTKSDPIRIK